MAAFSVILLAPERLLSLAPPKCRGAKSKGQSPLAFLETAKERLLCERRRQNDAKKIIRQYSGNLLTLIYVSVI